VGGELSVWRRVDRVDPPREKLIGLASGKCGAMFAIGVVLDSGRVSAQGWASFPATQRLAFWDLWRPFECPDPDE